MARESLGCPVGGTGTISDTTAFNADVLKLLGDDYPELKGSYKNGAIWNAEASGTVAAGWTVYTPPTTTTP